MTELCQTCRQSDTTRYPVLAAVKSCTRTRCPNCNREAILIDMRTAVKCLGISRRTVHERIQKGRISVQRVASRKVLIYYSSLFLSEEYEVLQR